jgi:hypothetical protein
VPLHVRALRAAFRHSHLDRAEETGCQARRVKKQPQDTLLDPHSGVLQIIADPVQGFEKLAVGNPGVSTLDS